MVPPTVAIHNSTRRFGGHQRLLAARRLGWKTVLIIFLDLSVEQSHLLNLALVKISGDWDQELLARMLADLTRVEDIDFSLESSIARSRALAYLAQMALKALEWASWRSGCGRSKR